MAFNNSTPDSVLNAPGPTFKFIHVNHGTSRADRRHGYTNTGKHFNIPADLQLPATNITYIKPK